MRKFITKAILSSHCLRNRPITGILPKRAVLCACIVSLFSILVLCKNTIKETQIKNYLIRKYPKKNISHFLVYERQPIYLQ